MYTAFALASELTIAFDVLGLLARVRRALRHAACTCLSTFALRAPRFVARNSCVAKALLSQRCTF